MLQKQSIDQPTYLLLKKLNEVNKLLPFTLGGGTALALQLGHRVSIDLDFFTNDNFDTNILVDELSDDFDINNITRNKNSLNCLIRFVDKEVKVDFLKHDYNLLTSVIVVENIRLFALEDIAAMKLNAIANRGAKKDFFDLYSLLEKFTFEKMLNLFEEKYPRINSFSVVKSLTYFNDADKEPDPVSLINISWEEVKERVLDVVRND